MPRAETAWFPILGKPLKEYKYVPNICTHVVTGLSRPFKTIEQYNSKLGVHIRPEWWGNIKKLRMASSSRFIGAAYHVLCTMPQTDIGEKRRVDTKNHVISHLIWFDLISSHHVSTAQPRPRSRERSDRTGSSGRGAGYSWA